MLEAAFIHRWFDEVRNSRNEAAIDEMFANQLGAPTLDLNS
jgi:hypothetical protein